MWIIKLILCLELIWSGGSMADFVDELLDPVRYDNRVRPGVDSGNPVVVFLDMYVLSIGSIDEVRMEYSVSIYMRQRWIDDRLTFTQYDEDITLNYNLFDRLWVPDLFVKNEKKATFHQITVPNRLLKLSPNGQVYYSQRLTLTLSCDMQLHYYPMDNQSCNIELESYGYTTRDIVFKWRDGEPVQVPETLTLPEFLLTNVSVGDCSVEYITGSFSCLFATLHLKRQFDYYLIQTFVPSCLIVALSWVSFWIDIYAVPARVTLGLLTVLTMTTQSSGISARLPRVSYIKAIDVWMTCCLVFVFGALIEYSIVNVIARKKEIPPAPVDKSEPTSSNGAPGNTGLSPLYGIDDSKKKKKPFCRTCFMKMKKDPALGLDIVSRGLFPSIFIVFNIIFWINYKTNAGDA